MGERMFQCDSRFTLDGKPAANLDCRQPPLSAGEGNRGCQFAQTWCDAALGTIRRQWLRLRHGDRPGAGGENDPLHRLHRSHAGALPRPHRRPDIPQRSLAPLKSALSTVQRHPPASQKQPALLQKPLPLLQPPLTPRQPHLTPSQSLRELLQSPLATSQSFLSVLQSPHHQLQFHHFQPFTIKLPDPPPFPIAPTAPEKIVPIPAIDEKPVALGESIR